MSGFIDAVDNIDSDLKARSGLCAFNQLLDQRYAGEDNAFTSTGNVREDTMFDGIVFRTIRRKVGNPNFQIEGIGECLQVLLKER